MHLFFYFKLTLMQSHGQNRNVPRFGLTFDQKSMVNYFQIRYIFSNGRFKFLSERDQRLGGDSDDTLTDVRHQLYLSSPFY
uniref:Secreted protein n=1 Tax=Heterorhabditis bacteriophora TaxID=37862 RepID=A0A1I7W6T7_HETBA